MHVQVGYALRNKAVIHMLSYNGNECEANIPQIVKDLVNMAGSDFFVWEVVVSALLNTPVKDLVKMLYIVYSVKDLTGFRLNAG